jgi:tRNA(Arg) A34 adenosine deaminase TadA
VALPPGFSVVSNAVMPPDQAPLNQATMVRLMEAARTEAKQSWQEGGIPVSAVLACMDGTIVAQGHNCRAQLPRPMCAGTAVMLGLRRVVIGAQQGSRGAEDFLRQARFAVILRSRRRLSTGSRLEGCACVLL